MLPALVVFAIITIVGLFMLLVLTVNYVSNPQHRIKFKRRFHRFAFFLFISTLLFGTSWLGMYGVDAAASSAKQMVREAGLFFQAKDAPTYDVVVLGGEPEGIAAAMAAARNGSRTLLLVQRERLGGLITYGWLNMLDMNHDADGDLLTQGIFAEFYQAMGGEAFDVGAAQQYFEQLVISEPLVKVIYNRRFERPIIGWDGETLVGIEVSHEGKTEKVFGRMLIDATQDAQLAAASGVPYTLGAEEIGWNRRMSVTQVFQLEGVDWPAVRRALNADGLASTGSTDYSAWGFIDEALAYPRNNHRFRLRGLNLGRQRDGTVMVNALQIFDVDGLSAQSRQQAIEEAKAELNFLVTYLKRNVPGFASAKLLAVAPELYIRETRHIIGEYRLTINDVMENRDFYDRIAIASYPVDIQAMSPDDWGYVVGNPVQYAIPLRCLVPLGIENLLVVGRSASYTSLAAGSTRVIPVGMVTGQAAGLTASYAVQEDVSVREAADDGVHVRRIQDKLIHQGAYLQAFSIENKDEGHWAYQAIRVLRPMGLIMGGYGNELNLAENITAESFVNVLYQAMQRAVPEHLPSREELFALADEDALYPRKMLRILGTVYRLPPEYLDYNSYDSDELYKLMVNRGMISREFQQHYDRTRVITRGQAYTLVLGTIKYYQDVE